MKNDAKLGFGFFAVNPHFLGFFKKREQEGKGLESFDYICIVLSQIEIAARDTNVLTTLGLRHVLADIMPKVEFSVYVSFDELEAADHGQFVHYFVSSQIYFGHTAYFRARPPWRDCRCCRLRGDERARPPWREL